MSISVKLLKEVQDLRSYAEDILARIESFQAISGGRHMNARGIKVRLVAAGLIAAMSASAMTFAHARSSGGLLDALEKAVTQVVGGGSVDVDAAGRLEVAFSPNAGAEALVVKVIDSAKRDVRVMAYSFTSAPVVNALIRAKHRGVKVSLVADQKSNTGEDRSGKSRAALSALNNAGADVRVISAYPIAHDKVVIVDERTVELGSFNFSAAAEKSNSENVLVNWDNPALAAVYLKHFERNYAKSTAYRSDY